MDTIRLAQGMIDESVPLAEFVQIILESRAESDPWTQRFATHAFMYKCSNATTSEWEAVKTVLNPESPPDNYLLKIGTLGLLFTDFSNPNRESQRADIIRSLLQADPADPCLETPYGNDVDDSWYDTIKPDWLAIVDEQPQDVRVLSNAARFFFRRDKEIAEQMYLKCSALEPENDRWLERLSKLREFHAVPPENPIR